MGKRNKHRLSARNGCGIPCEQTPFVRSKWIWHPEGNPAVAAPVGKRYFRRSFNLETNHSIASARMAMTVDNSFELWINGQRAGSGADFNQVFKFDVADLLKRGTNVIAVAAENGSDKPNPAGLLAALAIQFADGQALQINSDRQWRSATAAGGRWNSAVGTPRDWAKA